MIRSLLWLCLVLAFDYSARAAIPLPGESYPMRHFYADSGSPLRVTFIYEGNVPFNPEEVSPRKKKADLTVAILQGNGGSYIDIVNRTRTAIPLLFNDLGKSPRVEYTARANTGVRLRLRRPQDSLSLCIVVYDEGAIKWRIGERPAWRRR